MTRVLAEVGKNTRIVMERASEYFRQSSFHNIR